MTLNCCDRKYKCKQGENKQIYLIIYKAKFRNTTEKRLRMRQFY